MSSKPYDELMSKDAEQEAYRRGYAQGQSRASSVWDGNTPTSEYAYFLRTYNEGDLPDHYLSPDPLSGEWAGESIPELIGDLVPEDAKDDADAEYWWGHLEQAYEDAFRDAWYAELVRVATHMTTDN